FPRRPLARHRAGGLDSAHRLVREFRARRVAADHEHQGRVLVLRSPGDVHEAAYGAGREGDQVERLEVHVLELAALVLPEGAPGPGHGDESLVGVVVVQHRALARARPAVAEVESLGDLDRSHARGLHAHRRLLAPALGSGRLEADDVVENALAAGHLRIGQAAVGAFQLFEARHALHHLFSRDAAPRQGFPVFHDGLRASYYYRGGGMKAPRFAYARPASIAEALARLQEHGDDARCPEGG